MLYFFKERFNLYFYLRMVVANNATQWAELEPKRGFNFENYERNINLIKDKVTEKHSLEAAQTLISESTHP
jgi:hypothetical protein